LELFSIFYNLRNYRHMLVYASQLFKKVCGKVPVNITNFFHKIRSTFNPTICFRKLILYMI